MHATPSGAGVVPTPHALHPDCSSLGTSLPGQLVHCVAPTVRVVPGGHTNENVGATWGSIALVVRLESKGLLRSSSWFWRVRRMATTFVDAMTNATMASRPSICIRLRPSDSRQELRNARAEGRDAHIGALRYRNWARLPGTAIRVFAPFLAIRSGLRSRP